MKQKPHIVLSSRDMDRLDALLNSLAPNAFPDRDALRDELDRAEVVAPEHIPPDVVTMNSTVRFRMAGSDRDFRLTLVYPKNAGEAPDRISVLAPVGSALLGLAVGDKIEWPRPGGGQIKLTITDVVYQPERAGDLHR